MVEGGVDDGVRPACALAQAFQIVERATMSLCAHRREGRRSGVGAGEPEHLMARCDEFADDGGTDKAGRAGNEDAHVKVSKQCSEIDIARALIMLK